MEEEENKELDITQLHIGQLIVIKNIDKLTQI